MAQATHTAFAATQAHGDVRTLAEGTLPPASRAPRSTVLPRVAVEGDAPVLVHSDRERYEHARSLGQGGMGEVIQAVDNDIGRTVAVKRLLPEVVQDAGGVARFVEEIRTVGQLEHPNIVPIHDVGVDAEGRYYFVMKYVHGETLERVIAKLDAGDPDYHARFTFAHRVEVFMAVLEAVQYAHAQGFVHRDIKPANVMVGPYGEVMLMDWGIAKRIDAARAEAAGAAPASAAAPGQTTAGALIGTPAYMSPEQALGEPVDARSDVYSLCVMLHELLGLRHYLADCQTVEEVLKGAVLREAPHLGLRTHPHQDAVPADLAHFIHKGLSKDPAARFQSVGEMLARLRARQEGHIPVQCPVTLTRAGINVLGRFVDRHPRFVLGAVPLAGLMLVAAVVYAIVRLLA